MEGISDETDAKPDSYDQMSGHFSAVCAATTQGTFEEPPGHFASRVCWIFLTRCQDVFRLCLGATESNNLTQTLGDFSVAMWQPECFVFVFFDETSGHFPAIFRGNKTGNF